MSIVSASLVTAEEFADFVARPENSDRWFELHRGEIVELPPPKKPHGIVCANVARILGNYVVASAGGYVTTNDAAYITERGPDSVRGPDIAYWNDSQAISAIDPHYTESPPVVAIEVLSPDDRVNRLTQKINEYLGSGVQEVWVIDPISRDLAIHRPRSMPQFLSEDQEVDGGSTLPGFRCSVAGFFHALATGK